VTRMENLGDAAMARYAGGDDAAFATVYAAVAPRLLRFLRRRMRDQASVPDLAQEVLLQVHRGRATFAPGSAVVPWVLAIARRQLVDAYRRAPRETPADIDFEVAGAAALRASPMLARCPASGEDVVAAKEIAVRLGSAFTRLPAPQRAALELVKGQGLSLVDAASALGTTVTGVKLRAHRAYRTLRAELAADAAA